MTCLLEEQLRIIGKAREQFDEIPELLLEIDKETVEHIIPQLIQMGLVSSKSEFLRLVKQDGVGINQEKIAIDDLQRVLMNDEGIKIGKKRFVRFIK
ncbi:hypothetical protein [Lysinibacillus sp. 54212]|uniref:hypothetical protein n=1 Tax=Lysinibacillus sp. 54212 TaxID=3119829 RepID=UPI002FCC1A50